MSLASPVSTIAIEWVAVTLFAAALLHTFATKSFERLAHRNTRHAGVLHLLGEVEVVFGLWAAVLLLAMAADRRRPLLLAALPPTVVAAAALLLL
jgi:hypothetical protein